MRLPESCLAHTMWSRKNSALVLLSTCTIGIMILLFVVNDSVLRPVTTLWHDVNVIIEASSSRQHRRLQFEGMFDTQAQASSGPANAPKVRKTAKKGPKRLSRQQALSAKAQEVLLEQDLYMRWWTGPPGDDHFKPASWGASHTESNNAIFTMAVIQGKGKSDEVICSSPNDFKLFLGSARRSFGGDIVVAVESTISDAVKAVLIHYKAVVYVLPDNLCSQATRSIFCGSEEERVPASVFRYYFYEKWAAQYSENSLLMYVDFRDVFFQSNPFEYRKDEWFPEYQLVVFQEFHPNMVINRCMFNTRIMLECYGDGSLRYYGNRVIISSGAAIGSRDAIIIWSRDMTNQLQEAPGRAVDTRCTSGGIDHSFINWLVYSNKLRALMRTKLVHQGEGIVNTVGGLRPDTVSANITGSLREFWKILDKQGRILNWNGEVSPVVHQVDHFMEELEYIATDMYKRLGVSSLPSSAIHKHSTQAYAEFTPSKTLMIDSPKDLAVPFDASIDPSDIVDIAWQTIESTRCLWGCISSPKFP